MTRQPPDDRYPIPANRHRCEETIQRSRFITTLGPASTAEEAHLFVDAIRAEFPDATHNCWGFVACAPEQTTSVGMSDDGEPHGTAGRPILNTLLHSGVGEIVAVVTRYFGGVKLGKGGLSRAYSGGVASALETLPVKERVDNVEVDVNVPYGAVPGLRRHLADLEGRIVNETFDAAVTYRIELPRSRLGELTSVVGDLTGGQGTIHRV